MTTGQWSSGRWSQLHYVSQRGWGSWYGQAVRYLWPIEHPEQRVLVLMKLLGLVPLAHPSARRAGSLLLTRLLLDLLVQLTAPAAAGQTASAMRARCMKLAAQGVRALGSADLPQLHAVDNECHKQDEQERQDGEGERGDELVVEAESLADDALGGDDRKRLNGEPVDHVDEPDEQCRPTHLPVC